MRRRTVRLSSAAGLAVGGGAYTLGRDADSGSGTPTGETPVQLTGAVPAERMAVIALDRAGRAAAPAADLWQLAIATQTGSRGGTVAGLALGAGLFEGWSGGRGS